jgi:pimeloyl-ACP methyl ester carboxylesterase
VTRRLVRVGDATLAATVAGSGEPLLVVQTALSVDELVPLMRQDRLRTRYRLITFERRGYGDSTRGGAPPTIETDARDCLAVLAALDASPAHVIGVSYSAAVVLTMAASAPAAVRTLTVVEPPPRHVPAAPAFVAECRRLLDLYTSHGAVDALESVMGMLAGPGWRGRQERLAPGSVGRFERDADTFFSRDIAALLAWEFGAEPAARIESPVLYVGGSDSGDWFRQTEAWILSLFPAARAVTLDGGGHDLALTHPDALADAVTRFLDSCRPGLTGMSRQDASGHP